MYLFLPLFLLVLFFLKLLLAAYFHRYQNHGTRSGTLIGGEISWPKSFWLFYALISWFVTPMIFLIDGNMPMIIKLTLCIHLTVWWTRGILEKKMIYSWFNWSPNYGITHDLIHALGLFMVALFSTDFQKALFGSLGPTAHLAATWISATIFTTLAEAVFAAMFLKARGGTKNHLIYFASNEPKYRTINRITLVVVVLTYTHSLYLCLYSLRDAGIW